MKLNICENILSCGKVRGCKTCARSDNEFYNQESKDVVLLFDYAYDPNTIRKYLKTFEDLFGNVSYQVVFLSKYMYEFDKTLEQAHYNCASLHIKNELHNIGSKLIIAFGQKSLRYITQKQVNITLDKILRVENDIFNGYIYYMPSPSIVYRNHELVIDKYNAMILEARFNLQVAMLFYNNFIRQTSIKINEI